MPPRNESGSLRWRSHRVAAVALVALTALAAHGFLRHFSHTPSSAASAGPARDARPQAGDGPAPAEPGGRYARELRGGDAHSYSLKLGRGDYLRVLIEKGDAQLGATLYAEDGREVARFISRRYEQLRVSAVAEAWGRYRLEVRSLEQSAEARGYELRVEEVRAATRADEKDAAGARAFGAAEELRGGWTRESLSAAAGRYEEAARLWRSAGRAREASAALKSAGDVHHTLGEHAQALSLYERASAIARLTGDATSEAEALNQVGYIHLLRGEIQKALSYFSRCERLSEHGEEPPVVRARARTLYNVGEARYGLSDLRGAREFFRKSLDLSSRLEDRDGQAASHLHLGYAFYDSGDLQEAVGHYRQALALWRETGDRRGTALASTAAGGVESLFGEKESALESHRQALAVLEALGDRQGEVTTLNNVGQIYEDLNEPETALEHYGRALRLCRELSSPGYEAVTAYYVGRIHRALKDVPQALSFYNLSIERARAAGDRRVEAYGLTALGSIYADEGKTAQARERFERVLALYREVGDRRGQAYALNAVGQLHLRAGENSHALESFECSLGLMREAHDSRGEAATLYNIAYAEREQGADAEALRHVESAIKLVESVRARVARRALRTSYFASVHQFYELYIDVLMRMHAGQPGAGYEFAALQACERARARALYETLSGARAAPSRSAEPALSERERALGREIDAKSEYQMRLLNGRGDAVEVARVEEELRGLMSEYEEVLAQMDRQRSPYASLLRPPVLGPDEVRQELGDEDTLLLEYALGDRRSYLWAVTRNGVRAYELPGRAAVEEACLKLYALLTSRQERGEGAFADYEARAAADEAEYWERAAALSRMLLGPVAGELGSKRLLVVADGALHYVPFEALPEPVPGGEAGAFGGEGGAAPLLLRHEVVNLPSFSTLAALRRGQARRAADPKGILVFADPVFDTSDLRLVAQARPADGAEELGPLRSALRDVRAGDSSPLPRLPHTLSEADAIRSAAAFEEVKLATGFGATRAAVAGDDFARSRVIHFATHGLINSRHPELSGVVLSMFDERGRGQNGFLRLHDIYSLDLSAELVVLSACDTGRGKEVKGEGVVGLTHGFIYAGSRSIVASLWKVDDRATAELMRHFYDAMLRERLRPAAALRRAKEAMWRQKRWRAPFYWAAFTFNGEYAARRVPSRLEIPVGPLAISTIMLALTVGGVYLAWRRGRRGHPS